ncbi:hypothetical protein D3C74_371700 [compost metagenome]
MVCISRIIIGPVADSTAASPDDTYCSAQYSAEKVPKVSAAPVISISLRSSREKLALPLTAIQRNRTAPARKKRSPAEKKGGAPASTPILIARKVVPKIRQTSE